MQAMQQIFSNPLWTLLIGIAVTVVIAVIIYNKSRKVRKPTYYIRSNNLVADFSSKLGKQLFYGDTVIVNLTVSKIGFWNDGKDTIDWKDTVASDPIRIEAFEDCDILGANVIKEINTINKFRVELVSEKQIKILFDFLDKGQGGAIQVIHTGKESSDIKVDGFVKGAGRPKPSYTRGRALGVLDRIFSPPEQNKRIKPMSVKNRRSVAFLSFIVALLTLVMVLSDMSIPVIVFGVPAISVYVYFGYILLKRRVPKGLEIIEEEES